MTTNDFKDFRSDLTVGQVYYTSQVIPDGYEVMTFRVPDVGDLWLATSGTIVVGKQDTRYVMPRLILRKVNKNKTFLLVELTEDLGAGVVSVGCSVEVYPGGFEPRRSATVERHDRVSARDAMDALKAFATKIAEVKD